MARNMRKAMMTARATLGLRVKATAFCGSGTHDVLTRAKRVGDDRSGLRSAVVTRLPLAPLSRKRERVARACSALAGFAAVAAIRRGHEGEGVIRLARRYAELATTTNFSFLRGASHPEELVARAAALGLSGIGIADRNTLAGVVRAHVYARENREALGAFRVVTGTRLAFVDGAPDVIVYPQDRAAYGRLSRLLSQGNLRAPKGECHLRFDELLESAEGLQAIAMPLIRLRPPAPEGSSPAAGGEQASASRNCAKRSAAGCGSARVRLTAPTCAAGSPSARRWRARLGAPLIAVNDVLMHDPERRPLADVVACIREKTTLAAAGLLTQANAERHLKGPEEMARLFAEAPDALEETMRFLDGDRLQPRRTRLRLPRGIARGLRHAASRRSKPSPRPARRRAIPTASPTACAPRSTTNSR